VRSTARISLFRSELSGNPKASDPLAPTVASIAFLPHERGVHVREFLQVRSTIHDRVPENQARDGSTQGLAGQNRQRGAVS